MKAVRLSCAWRMYIICNLFLNFFGVNVCLYCPHAPCWLWVCAVLCTKQTQNYSGELIADYASYLLLLASPVHCLRQASYVSLLLFVCLFSGLCRLLRIIWADYLEIFRRVGFFLRRMQLHRIWFWSISRFCTFCLTLHNTSYMQFSCINTRWRHLPIIDCNGCDCRESWRRFGALQFVEVFSVFMTVLVYVCMCALWPSVVTLVISTV